MVVDGFPVTYTRHSPDQVVAAHAHERAAITAVLRGGFVEVVEDRAFDCSAGSVLFKRAGATHENRYQRTGARSLIVEIPESTLEVLWQGYRSREPDPAAVVSGASWAQALSFHRLLLGDETGLGAEELLAAIVTRGLEEATSPATSPPPWLRRVRDSLEAWPIDRTPSLAELAREADVHPVYLARAFRGHFGTSVGEYLQRRRVDQAVAGLLEHEEPLSSMAVRLGYYDQAHFTRWFRRYCGATPGRFRRWLGTL